MSKPSFIPNIDFRPDGKVLAIALTPDWSVPNRPADFAALKLWHTDTYQESTIFEDAFPEHAQVVQFSSDGDLLAVAQNAIVNIWDLKGKQWLFPPYWNACNDIISCLVFTSDTKYLIGVEGSCQLFVWEVSTHPERKWLQLVTDQPSTYLAISPEGSELATGSATGAIELLEVDGIVALFEDDAQFDGGHQYFGSSLWSTVTFLHRGGVSALRYSPIQKLVASGGEDGFVKLWDTVTKQEISTLNHGSKVESIDFSPDGALLFSSGGDTFHVWDLSTCQQLETFNMSVTMRYSPGGGLLALATNSGQVSLWNYPRQTPSEAPTIVCKAEQSTGDGQVHYSANGSSESKSVETTWPTQSTTVTFTYEDCTNNAYCNDANHRGQTVTQTYAIGKPEGSYTHTRRDPKFVSSRDYVYAFKFYNHIQSWPSGHQVHHILPEFMGGYSDESNLQLVANADLTVINRHCNSGHPALTSYCVGTEYKVK